MTLKQLTIEAMDLSDQLWLAQVEIETTLKSEMNKTKIANLIAGWTRLNSLKDKAMKRANRRLGKQIDAGEIG